MSVRICVVGGGIAATALAWRLGRQHAVEVDLVAPRRADATAASAGAVRAFDRDERQRALALSSLVELLSSPLLLDWADYRRTGFTYVLGGVPGAGVRRGVAQLAAALPGSVSLGPAPPQWPGRTAVIERHGGHIDPHRLRNALGRDLGGSVHVHDEPAAAVAPGRVHHGGRWRDCDVVVVAAGAWTPGLLGNSGYPDATLRTKLIRFATHRVAGTPPVAFLDERAGLFGLPWRRGVLIGLPTEEWDVDPSGPARGGAGHHARAEAGARRRGLGLGARQSTTVAADCYSDSGLLALRPVPGAGPGLATFTGGSGGAAKTALAASAAATTRLASGEWAARRPPAESDRPAVSATPNGGIHVS